MKATEQYFPVVLFIMLDKVVLAFESLNEIRKFNQINGHNMGGVKDTEQHSPVVLFITLYAAVLTFASVN